MLKILSCLLSFTIIFTSVTPSLAQIRGTRQIGKVSEGVKNAGRKVRETTPKSTVKITKPHVSSPTKAVSKVSEHTPRETGSNLQRKVEGGRAVTPRTSVITDRALLNHAQSDLKLTHVELLPRTSYVPTPVQILNHVNRAERALLLRSDFPILALNKHVQTPEMSKALEFYRTQLGEVKFTQFVKESRISTTDVNTLAGTVADISSLGLLGEAEHDAALILEVYQKSIGTAAEPVITASASHALLRLGAYKELEKMSEISSMHPELWEEIASYGKINNLPFAIFQKERTVVDMTELQPSLEKFGQLTAWSARVDAIATMLYMNAGKGIERTETELSTSRVAKIDSSALPEGFELIEEPKNSETPLYASAGSPVANTEKVQPVMPTTPAQAVEPVFTTASPATTVSQASAATPKYVQVETTNTLGEKVLTWKLNPKYSEEQATATSGAKIGTLDRIRVEASTALLGLRMLLTSRYGWMGAIPGISPLTAETAVHEAPGRAVIENVRAAQREFISVEELTSGSGARAYTGRTNVGGMVAQQASERTVATAKKAQKTASKSSTATTSATTGTKTTRPVTIGGKSSSGIAASSLIPLPKSWLGMLTGTADGTSKDLQRQANKQAQNILNQMAPLATRLVSILQTSASDELKQQALVRLYKMGKLNDILQQSLPPAAVEAVVALGREGSSIRLGQRLYSLYTEQLISEGVNAITDTVEQGALRQELTDIVSAPGFASQSRALWEAATKIPVMSVEDIGTTSFVPEADLERVYSAFRTDANFVEEHIEAQDKGSVVHYDKHIPFYYRDSHGKLSERPVGILTQAQPGWYGNMLSHIPLFLKMPKWNAPSTWFKRSSWKMHYMADKSGLDIPKGFVLALDENGQWKFVKQDRELAESYPESAKLLREIENKGAVQVGLDTPYSTADMLAIAKMLEKKTHAQMVDKLTTPLSFELELNPADSFKQMLKVWGFYIGLDTGAVLTGPFKSALKGIEGAPINAVANIVGGLGYLSPLVAAVLSKWMREMGLKVSMYGLFAAAGVGLGYSLFGLGMTGFDDPKLLGLGEQTIPLVAAIFTGSLFGLLQPLVLNHYKNPVARTAANLEFSSTKQKARMMLTTATFALGLHALGGLSWTLAIPAAFGLLGASFLLFLNTPLVRSASRISVEDKTAQNLLATIQKTEEKEISDDQKKAEAKEFGKSYKEVISKSAAVKGIRDRVMNVYAGYAPLLAVVSQVVNAEGTLPLVGGEKISQLAMVGFMYCAYKMRTWATSVVKSNRYTDDQLTGLSLPILAASSTAIMLMPFNSIWALATAAVVAALYVGTAVPGQLDNTRMQNIVSEEVGSRKKAVQADKTLTPEERDEKLAKLNRQEKDWGFRASRDYSIYNGVGLAGVVAATAIAYFLSDHHVADNLLQALQMYGENSVFTMDRLIFGVSSVVLGALAWRHRNLTADFLRARNPIKITEENIQSGNVNAAAFGISQGNVGANLGKLNKNISDLQKLSIEHGLSSEKKMTDMLNKMVTTYNRLLAVKEVKGMDVSLQGSFNDLMTISQGFREALAYNKLSVMLNREFDKFRFALSKDGKLEELSDDMTYLEEGTYKLPAEHAKFEEAKDLIQKDLFQLAHRILNGSEVDSNTYRLFMEYVNRARVDLQTYTQANVADSKRALDLIGELNGICQILKKADATDHILSDPKHSGPTSKKDIQALRDMLAGFPDE